MVEEQTSEHGPQPPAKPRRVRGTVYIDVSRCKGCGFCIAFCPPHVLEFASDYNAQGYRPPHLARPEGCTGCDLCGLYCPDFAIFGIILRDTAREAPAQAATAAEAAP